MESSNTGTQLAAEDENLRANELSPWRDGEDR